MVETLTYTYTTQAEIERIFGAFATSARTSDSEGDYANVTAILSDVVDEATDHINAYLETLYAPSRLTESRTIRRWATYLACHFLSLRRGNPGQYAGEYERITRILNEIRAGRRPLPRVPPRNRHEPAMSNYVIDQRFVRRKIRRVPTTSVGTYTNSMDEYFATWDFM